MKTLKNGPQKLLIISPDPFISQSSPDHCPQPRIDFSYYEISGPDNCSLICDVHQLLFFLAETNLVARGETSADFYFHTLPSSPPTALTCEGNSNSLNLTWKYSEIGMYKESNNQATKYRFIYQLSTSK